MCRLGILYRYTGNITKTTFQTLENILRNIAIKLHNPIDNYMIMCYNIYNKERGHTAHYHMICIPYKTNLPRKEAAPVLYSTFRGMSRGIPQKGFIMKIYSETSLKNFQFWSGAKDVVKFLTDAELDYLESILESEIFPDGASETEINDFFWFEDDTIAEFLGYSDFGEIMNRE